jgi:hypothetical protein
MYKPEQMERNSNVPREGDVCTVRLRKVFAARISHYENTAKRCYNAGTGLSGNITCQVSQSARNNIILDKFHGC